MKVMVMTALCLLSILLACGCMRYRSVAAADVTDIGMQIRTHFRYSPSWQHDKEIKGVGERLRTCMKRCQPHVFADDGIPISIVEGEESHEDWGCWTINRFQDEGGWASKRVLFGLSFSIIPLFNGTESVESERVWLAGERRPVARFRLYRRQDTAFSFTPLPILLYYGLPDMRGCENGVVRVRRENSFGDEDSKSLKEHPEGDEVLAYALAAKLKELEDTGKITAATLQAAARERLYRKESIAKEVVRTTPVSMPQPKTGAKSQPLQQLKSIYTIETLMRENSSDFVYTFALKLKMDVEPSIEAFFGIQGIFAREVLDAYQTEYPNVDVSILRVYVLPRLVNGRIEGRAAVLPITPISLTYDSYTRHGKLSVRFNAGQSQEAREWIRKNIETLARDKNIALVTGQRPPEARYYLLGEKVDGNVMEIEFKTE